MKAIHLSLLRIVLTFLIFNGVTASEVVNSVSPTKITTDSNSAEDAFKTLQAASTGNRSVYSGEELKDANYRKKNEELAKDAVAAYQLAMDFLQRFPESEHASTANLIGLSELATAVEAGDQKMKAVLEKWVTDVKRDPSVSEETKIEFAWHLVTALNPDRGVGLENGVREFLKEFSGSEKAYERALRLTVMRREAARGFFQELADDDKTPANAKASARGFLKRLNVQGNLLEMSFTARDGREIDLAKLKGKVVLVYFWATSCGPCVGETPMLKAVYDKHHDKGFEIIAISLDDDAKTLDAYRNKNQITWPQHFDGNGWRNKFAVEYGIVGIPVMWLVDKTGTVITTNAVNIRHNLDKIVAHLLSQ